MTKTRKLIGFNLWLSIEAVFNQAEEWDDFEDLELAWPTKLAEQVDPDTVKAFILDNEPDITMAQEAIEDLDDWIQKQGGFHDQTQE